MDKLLTNTGALIAFAEGKQIEYFSRALGDDARWKTFDPSGCSPVLCQFFLTGSVHIDWRIKPGPKVTWWNFYDGLSPTAHTSRESADDFENSQVTKRRIACVRVVDGDGL